MHAARSVRKIVISLAINFEIHWLFRLIFVVIIITFVSIFLNVSKAVTKVGIHRFKLMFHQKRQYTPNAFVDPTTEVSIKQ